MDMPTKNIFQKADHIKRLVENVLKRKLTDNEIMSILARADAFKRGITKRADGDVANTLVKLNDRWIKPNTAYKWVRYSCMPAHIKESVYARRISYHKALQMCTDEKAAIRNDLESKIFELGMKAIESLDKGGR